MKKRGQSLLIAAFCLSSALAQDKGIGSVFLKLLEPIAPQSSRENQDKGEVVTSDLGDLLKDPKNESLKAIKVIGTQKRVRGDSKEFTMITWKEVALETSQGAENRTSLKEPIEKPLESSFIQSSETVESGTPIEAKGSGESLLAAARTLMIRAQKEGFKGDAVSVSPVQTVNGYPREGDSQGSFKRPQEDDHAQRSKTVSVSTNGSGKNPASSVLREENRRRLSENRSGGDQGRNGMSSPTQRSREFSYGAGFQTSSPSGLYERSEFSSQGGQDRRSKREKKTKDLAQEAPVTVSILTSGADKSETGLSGTDPRLLHEKQDLPEGDDQHIGESSSKNPKRGRSSSFSEGRQSSEGGEESETKTEPKDKSTPVVSSETATFDQGSVQETGALHSRPSRSAPFTEGGEHTLGDQESEFPFARTGNGDGKKGKKAPVIRVEYDYKMCGPRVDWALNQVVLQAQAITFEDEAKVSESECADTHKKFAIQKDYRHAECFDVVEKVDSPLSPSGFGFAYATYKPYWVNESSERVYLKEPQKDEEHPFALQEEEGRCSYAVDVESLKAMPQSELVYSNRTKQRIVVETCRPSFEAKTVAIQATKKGCGIVHQFDQNRSMPQQRLIYTVKGVEHEVLPCHDVSTTWIKHQFDGTGCKPVVDESTKTQQPFAKRVIKVGGDKITISDCEPYGNKTPLLMDETACSHKPYHHDLVGSQSYLNIRYYYDHSHGKKYVTGCQPGTKTFKHKKTMAGYVHDDINKLSKPKSEISFTHNGQKVCVVPARIDEEEKASLYIKEGERTETKAYHSKMNDRCYQEQRFKQKALFKRVDGSSYEQDIQDKVTSADICVRTTEKKEEPAFVTVMGCEDFFDEGAAHTFEWGTVTLRRYGYHPFDAHHLYNTYPSRGYFCKTDKLMERIKTVYPESPKQPEYTAWEWTGYYRDHSLTAGAHGGLSVYPLVEGKTWHHTERKF
jgi:hypothetical protein